MKEEVSGGDGVQGYAPGGGVSIPVRFIVVVLASGFFLKLMLNHDMLAEA